MKIIAISDTHEQHKWLDQFLYDPEFIKDVDMIICAGDTANSKSPVLNHNAQLKFIDWYAELPFKYKIYVPGNHNTSEHGIYKDIYEYNNIYRLIHELVVINKIRIFGSPYTPTFGTGWVYNVPRHKINTYWDEIPDNTDILITHGPPKGILDLTHVNNTLTEQVGCKSLLNHVLGRVKPNYHIFGHLHDEENIFNYGYRLIGDTTFINASIVDLHHNPINLPIKIEYESQR